MQAPLTSDVIELLEVPYRIGGRDLAGMDCFGVVKHLYAKQGIALPDYRTPEDQRQQSAVIASQLPLWEPCAPAPGAGIVFRLGRLFSHVGMQIDERRFVHAWDGASYVVIEKLADWQNRIHGYFRYVGPR